MNVEIDGKPVAQLKSPRFTRILLSPAPHRIAGYTGPAAGRKPGGELDFTANAGDVLLMTAEVVRGMVGTITQFKLADLAAHREKLSKTRMVQPDVAEI